MRKAANKRLPKLRAPKPQPMEVHKSDEEGEPNPPKASTPSVKLPKDEPIEDSSVPKTKKSLPSKAEEDEKIESRLRVKIEMETTPMEIDTPTETPAAEDLDDEVLAEFPVVLLRPPENSEISRLLFHQEHPSRLQGCKARAKRNVKHLELNYEGTDDHDEVFNGIYTGESQSMTGDQLRHAVCFFEKGQFCMLPICDTYDMGRKLVNTTAANKKKSVAEEDSELAAELGATEEQPSSTQPQAGPIRIKFQKHESEWQKKRREQSAHHRQMLFEKDPWVEMKVQRINARKVFSAPIRNSATKAPAIIRKDFIPPVL